MAKADVVKEAVSLGLGTEEELGKLTVKELTAAIDNQNGMVHTPIQAVETKEESACAHDWHKVRVIASPNYTCIKCKKCGAEKKVND